MKKVTLDLLKDFSDVKVDLSDLSIDASEADQILSNQEGIEKPIELIAQVGSTRKWALNKLLIIAVPMGLGVLAVTGIILFYLNKPVSSVPETKTAVVSNKPDITEQVSVAEKVDKNPHTVSQSDTIPETHKVVYLRDFIIDLKDAKGNSFLLMCDIAFDVGGKTKPETLENNRSIRHIIYKTAQNRSVVALRSVEERKKMKVELISELEKILGEGSVKNVYFMNYFIM